MVMNDSQVLIYVSSDFCSDKISQQIFGKKTPVLYVPKLRFQKRTESVPRFINLTTVSYVISPLDGLG